MKRKRFPFHKTIGSAGAMIFILALGHFPVQAQEPPLTMEEAISKALKQNERARTADREFDAARARVAKARSYFFPQLTAVGTYTRRPYEVKRTVGETEIVIQSLNGLAGYTQLNMALFDSHNIPTLIQAKSERNAQELASAESKRQLAFEVGNAFLTTLGVDQVLEASRHRFEYARQTLEAARARYAAGLVSVNDVTRAELEVATAEMSITQNKGQVETTFLQLGYLLNEMSAVSRKLRIPEAVLKIAAEGETRNPEALIEEAQNRRLDLGALRHQAKARHALVLEPLLKWLPSLSLNGQYRYTNEAGLTGRSTNWNAGLTLNWSLFDGFARNADTRERKALAVLADLEVQTTMRKVELDVRDTLVALTNQRASLKQAAVALEVARRNAKETSELYRQGLSTALQVADANVSLFEAEVTLARERYGLGVAYLNFEAALGLDPFGKEPTP